MPDHDVDQSNQSIAKTKGYSQYLLDLYADTILHEHKPILTTDPTKLEEEAQKVMARTAFDYVAGTASGEATMKASPISIPAVEARPTNATAYKRERFKCDVVWHAIWYVLRTPFKPISRVLEPEPPSLMTLLQTHLYRHTHPHGPHRRPTRVPSRRREWRHSSLCIPRRALHLQHSGIHSPRRSRCRRRCRRPYPCQQS